MKRSLCLWLFAVMLFFSVFLSAEQKQTLAVAEFEGKSLSMSELSGISEFIRAGLVNTELFNVVDRKNMEAILEEQKFQISGCMSEECAVKMGKFLNVQKMVTGKVIKIGEIFYITANVIDVETGKIVISQRVDSPDMKQLADKSESIAAMIANRLLGKRPTAKSGIAIPTEETVAKGSANIQSDPPDAEIFIDGEKKGKTPMLVKDISIGQRQLVLMKEGYVDKSVQLNIVADTTAKIDEILTQMLGSMLVKSTPAGAKVFFDGIYKGKTDGAGIKISGIILGEHTLKYEKEKFYPFEQKIVVKYKMTAEINPILKEKPGAVFVTSTPKGANVYLDETSKGTTPLKIIGLSAGSHEIKLSADGYNNWSKQVKIHGLETETVTADMEPGRAVLEKSEKPKYEYKQHETEQVEVSKNEKDSIEIDREWVEQGVTKNYVFARGIGAADQTLENKTQKMATSRNSAIVNAQYNMLSVVKGVKLEGGITEKAIETDSMLATTIDTAIKSAQVVRSEWTSDDGCIVILQLSKKALKKMGLKIAGE